MIVLYSEDKFPDGEYRGKTVREVYAIDKKYVKRFNSTVGDYHKGKSSFKAKYAISDETIIQLQRDEVDRLLSIRSERII
jgi:hypothetical protein